MKAALTVWDGRVSPVFDVSREAVILTIENGTVAARRSENIDAPTAALKIDRLMELGVETLICGAISEPLHRELTARGVRVLGFVAGEIDEVVKAFVAGRLSGPRAVDARVLRQAAPVPRGAGLGCGRGQGQRRKGR